ncbi:MAG: DUF6268 family outer membrane beta-barrel protein [Bacteroidota bacterium]
MRNVFIIVGILWCLAGQCQFLDLARVEYTLVPGDHSNFDYSRRRVLFNFPFRIHDEAYFFAGVDYSNIKLSFTEDIDSFDKDETDDFSLLDLNFTYTFQMNEDWRFAAQVSPGISSNLESGLEWNDLVFSSVVVFIKDKKMDKDVKKPFRIIIGAAFSGNGGVPFPIPFVSFYKKFHPKWSYNIGAPISNFQYHASEKVRLKLFATLDGFNANLQNSQQLSSGELANRIRLNMVLLGSRFEYKLSDHVESFLTVTRSVNPSIQLRQNRDRLLTLRSGDVMHYRLGVRFKI